MQETMLASIGPCTSRQHIHARDEWAVPGLHGQLGHVRFLSSAHPCGLCSLVRVCFLSCGNSHTTILLQFGNSLAQVLFVYTVSRFLQD
jgi:hypothetical protein